MSVTRPKHELAQSHSQTLGLKYAERALSPTRAHYSAKVLDPTDEVCRKWHVFPPLFFSDRKLTNCRTCRINRHRPQCSHVTYSASELLTAYFHFDVDYLN